MKLTNDEQMLILLYGDGTRAGLEKALIQMKEQLQPDELELLSMTGQLLKKIHGITEEAFKCLVGED